MSDKGSLEFKNVISSEEVASFLQALAKSFRQRAALLKSGRQSLGLEIGSAVKVELEARADPEKGKGTIELNLSRRGEEQVEGPPTLEIVPSEQVPPGSLAPSPNGSDRAGAAQRRGRSVREP